MEYYFASDASAVIEHTNRVIFLEDDDVAAVVDGEFVLTAHSYEQRAASPCTNCLTRIMNAFEYEGKSTFQLLDDSLHQGGEADVVAVPVVIHVLH